MLLRNFKILTSRRFNKHPVWHLVYEWEDVFSSVLNIKLQDRKIFYFFVKAILKVSRPVKFFNRERMLYWFDDLQFNFLNKKDNLCIHIYPRSKYYFSFRTKHMVPWIIDFDKDVSIKEFQNTYSKHKLVLISSLNALNYLNERTNNLNLKHLPLSISDRHQLSRVTYFKNRQYDLIFPGRPNKTLLQWAKVFGESNPWFEWFSYKNIDNRNLYVSNKGREIECRTRNAYLDLLKNCKVAVYTTQKVDGNIMSLDHITAKLFELVYTGCLLIGMYSETDESKAFHVSEICPAVSNYNDFETTLKNYIDQARKEEDFLKYKKFLDANRTSLNAKKLLKLLQTNGY